MISDWYASEWKIPHEQSKAKLLNLQNDPFAFHLLMYRDNKAIATAGVHSQLSILDKLPHLRRYPHWLALVYTLPGERGKGYGAMICHEAERVAADSGIKELALFTHSAENLYTRLEWELVERIRLPDRDIAVMKKNLR